MTTKLYAKSTRTNRPMSRSLKAGLAMAVACLAISPALADTVTNIPGGYVHTWTGNHGETFQVTRNNNTGQSVTKVDRHDGRGFVIFNTPPRPRVVKPYGGSLYDPETNRTTSVVVVPIPGPIAFPPMRGRMVEEGNTLREHGNWMPRPTRSRISGAVYDPESNTTTSGVLGPNGAVRTVEQGNTLERHGDMRPHGYTGRVSGSAYDPDTGRTTTFVGGPGGSARVVEEGNTLREHGNWMPRPTRGGHYSGAAYDPETNRTTGGSGGPNGAVRTVEDGNTLDRYGEMPRRAGTGRYSGSAYDPEPGRTTTIVSRPGMYGRLVEMGNTLGRH